MMGYRTYQEFEEQLSELSKRDDVEVGEFGKTFLGKSIPYIKIGDKGPVVLTVAGTHPHELLAEEFLLSAVEDVLQNPFDALQLYFVPIFNIDGYVAMSEAYAISGRVYDYRKNLRPGNCSNEVSHGVDLNRNYDFKWGLDNEGSSPHHCMEDYRGAGPFSEPETRGMKNFFDEHDVAFVVGYHAWGNLYITPYNYLANSAPGLYDSLEDYHFYRSLLDIVPPRSVVGTAHDLLGYYANGVFVDWAYHKGALSLAVELGNEFRPHNPRPTIEEHMPTYRSLLNSTVPTVTLNSTTDNYEEDVCNCTVTLHNPSLTHLPDSKLVLEFEIGVYIIDVTCNVSASYLVEADRITIEFDQFRRLSTVECTAAVQFSSPVSFGITFNSAYVTISQDKQAKVHKYFSIASIALLVFASIALIAALLVLCRCLYEYFNSSIKFHELKGDELAEIELRARQASNLEIGTESL